MTAGSAATWRGEVVWLITVEGVGPRWPGVVCRFVGEDRGLPRMEFSRSSSEDSGMYRAAFVCPVPAVLARLDELGLETVGQYLESKWVILACGVVEPDRWCGCKGAPRGTVVRSLAHEPFSWWPTRLLVTVRRYWCRGCGQVRRQDTARVAEPRARSSRPAARWALDGIVVAHVTLARTAEGLAVS